MLPDRLLLSALTGSIRRSVGASTRSQRPTTGRAGPASGARSERAADQHRLGDQLDAEPGPDAVADLPGQRQQVRRLRAPPRLVSASVCLVEIRAGPDAVALARSPACSISQAALVLTVPSACGQRGRLGRQPAAASAASSGLVKNDPALQVSWSASSSTMPLPRRSAEHRRRAPAPAAAALADLGAEACGPARRSATGADRSPSRQLEGHLEHEEAAGSALNRLVR